MHSTEALPFPPHPSVEQYRKLAKELAAAVKSARDDDIRTFFEDWFERLWRANRDVPHTDESPRHIAEYSERLTRYFNGTWTPKDVPPPRRTLAHAQFVIAKIHGFASWAAMVRHIEETGRETAEARFERAVDAVITGDIDALRTVLREHPDLVRERSSRAHGCTLLHYVSANGVEGYRQKTPHDIVAITKLLLEAGADVNAEARCYGSDDKTLGLTATSMHPHNAGVMIPLLDTLVSAGASIALEDEGRGIIHSCLANGQPQAAAWLAEHGARVDLPGAAGIGRLDVMKGFLAADGTLLNGATEREVEEGFRNASWYGQVDAIRYLLGAGFDVTRCFEDGATGLHHAAYDGNPDVVELLLARGAPVEVRDRTHNGNALDWALWAWGADNRLRDDPSPYYTVIAMLVRAGETVKPAWYESEGGRKVMDKVKRDPKMQAALRGD